MNKPERFHLGRASLWILLAPIVLLTDLKGAVWFAILLLLYSNVAGDISRWWAARETRRRDDLDNDGRGRPRREPYRGR